jgi:dienelactone hydrolase
MERITIASADGVRLEGELRMPDDPAWGAMGSGGTHGGGRDELRDVSAAVRTIRDRLGDAVHTIVVGWSFGASVALRAALDDARIDALALVGIPLRPGDQSMPPLPDPIDLRSFRRPTLLIAGEHDTYAPGDEVPAYAATFPQAEVLIIPGTDHFLWRHEKDAAARGRGVRRPGAQGSGVNRAECPFVFGSICRSRRGRRIHTNGRNTNVKPKSQGHTKNPSRIETRQPTIQSHGLPHQGRAGPAPRAPAGRARERRAEARCRNTITRPAVRTAIVRNGRTA